jgi:thiamine-monophosphate kinase
MSSLDEFALITRHFAPLASGFPGALGLTDDAALIDGPAGRQWAVTTDAIVAGVHFLPDDPPELIARKLVRVNLSDLAAMGAKPIAILLAACFPHGTDDAWLDRFSDGIRSDCAEFSIALVGGDTVATPGPLTLTLTALGDVAAGSALLRSNARSGDQIWVSGTIGDAAFGLEVARGGGGKLPPAEAKSLVERYRLPQPRVHLGPALVGLARAAMDVSDGLIGDLGHICRASGVAAVVEAASVPLSPACQAAIDAGLGEGLGTVLSGGDDYELLFTAPPSATGQLISLGEKLDLRLTPFGSIMPGTGVTVRGPKGRPMRLSGGGYRHFNG